jgi:hypothetical protein
LAALHYALGTQHPVYGLPTAEALRQALAPWVAQGWVLLVEGGAQRGAGSWFQWLQAVAGARLFRLSPAAAQHDLARYLTPASPVRVLLAPHADPGTGVHLDLEELFFRTHALRPDVLCIADVSHSLGLVPFYANAWGAGAVVYSRSSLGHWVCTAQPLGGSPAPGGLTPLMLRYALAAQQQGLPQLWNATHAEARAFRAWVQAQGGALTSPFAGPAFTAFAFAQQAPQATAEWLRQRHGWQVGVAQGLHRQPHCIVQHAPGGWAPPAA